MLTSCGNPAQEKKDTETSNVSPYYQEQHRLQFHFSPETQWMNDPNGMVYYDGEYHLFYQYYPDSNVWGPMHWGHTVSKDMIHWEHLPIGLYPDELGYIFSGSAVVDWNNTSGFGKDGQPPLIAIFTYHDMEGERDGKDNYQTQGIAYSNDKGRTWTKYEGNPVIANPGIKDFRDPKVNWHEESQQWVMVFACGDRLQFYNSANLKDWTLTSEFGLGHGSQARPWECPDLFELPVEGTDEKKWVLLVSLGNGGPNGGSATQYFIGDFDGKTFTNDNPEETTLWIDYGRDNYAGVTWSDIPKEDGRRIFLGWMSNWQYAQIVPTTVWRSAMTLPRVLRLLNTPTGMRLCSTPVAETSNLRNDKTLTLASAKVSGALSISDKTDISPEAMEIILSLVLSEGAQANLGLELKNTKGEIYRIGFDAAQNQYYSDRTNAGKTDFSDQFAPTLHTAPRISQSNKINLHVFLDSGSIEMFADDGTIVMTDLFFPNENFTELVLFAENGEVLLKEGVCYGLSSIWN